MEMEEVSEAELLAAGRLGRVLDCADGGARRPVGAGLLRRCCLELKDQIDPRGLRLRHASVRGPVDLAGLEVPFPLRFEGCEFDSALLAENAQLRELALTGTAALPGLLANGLHVRGDLDLSRSRVAGVHPTSASITRRSAIWLCEADIGGRLLCLDTSISAGQERAIQADRMRVGGTVRLLHQFTAVGEVRLLGARIGGSLDVAGARIESRGGTALDLSDASIGGNLFITDDPIGRRPLIRGRSVVAVGAQLSNPGDVTLSLHQATVGGSVILSRGFSSVGLVVLSRCTIAGRLECDQGSFRCPAPHEGNDQGHAIEAVSASVRGGMDPSWTRASPSVDFTNAATSFLADDPANWPDRILISGFTYDRFEPRRADPGRVWEHRARSAWLARQAVYDAGPYEQAARVFRQHGYTSAAEGILIAQRAQARQLISGRGAGLRRALDAVFGATVAYGYRPGRVAWLLAVLLILVLGSLEIPAARATLRATNSAGVVYTTRGALVPAGPGHAAAPDVCGGGQVRCFSAVLYTIDTVIPLVSLEQRSTWYPDPHTPDGALVEWWLNAATLLGWLLSSILALSLARLARAS